MGVRAHSVVIDPEKCIGCVDCTKICPTRAIRVRNDLARVDPDLCTDCGACIAVCRYEAAKAKMSSTSDLKRYKWTIAIPSMTLYTQFGRDVDPGQILRALTEIGFDSYYDISWMYEMINGAADAYLSECNGPWPKITSSCPAIVRLVQIRYPDMIPNLVTIESARELSAKLLRKRVAIERNLDPSEIGIFFISPCSAIMNSIVSPVGMEQSHLDGAFSIREVYGPILKQIRKQKDSDEEIHVSPRGILWSIAGGQTSAMRSANTMVVEGGRDVQYVFDRIEAGKFQSVDLIEAHICPHGCVAGQLAVEGRYAAQRSLRHIARRLRSQDPVKEEKVRSLLREHFFDLEEGIPARTIQPLARDLRQAIELKQRQETILESLPGKQCAACGAPDCRTFAEDVVKGEATLEDCVFVGLDRLRRASASSGEESDE